MPVTDPSLRPGALPGDRFDPAAVLLDALDHAIERVWRLRLDLGQPAEQFLDIPKLTLQAGWALVEAVALDRHGGSLSGSAFEAWPTLFMLRVGEWSRRYGAVSLAGAGAHKGRPYGNVGEIAASSVGVGILVAARYPRQARL